MKKNLSDYFVAFAVIACSLGLLAALSFSLGGGHGVNKGRTLEVLSLIHI